ncbi:unnamed protein product, partial [Notodromas monacha]
MAFQRSIFDLLQASIEKITHCTAFEELCFMDDNSAVDTVGNRVEVEEVQLEQSFSSAIEQNLKTLNAVSKLDEVTQWKSLMTLGVTGAATDGVEEVALNKAALSESCTITSCHSGVEDLASGDSMLQLCLSFQSSFLVIQVHPEIKTLFGYDTRTKWMILVAWLVQMSSLWIVKDLTGLPLFLMAYCFNGVINHSFTLAIHEISHNLAFGASRPWANNMLGIFVNLPLGVPVFGSFKKYHREHHKYLSVDGVDTDLPTALEGWLFNRTWTKILWLFLQPLFYAFRPMAVYPRSFTAVEAVNVLCTVAFDALVVQIFGWKCLFFLIGSSLLTMGLHPMGAHFISEHYMFNKGFETYSYYGPFNYIMWNVGYHNEHHDFPNIPFTRLPEVKFQCPALLFLVQTYLEFLQLRKMAPEFYENLPTHDSMGRILFDWIFDPNIGPYTRLKRKQLGFVNWSTDPKL